MEEQRGFIKILSQQTVITFAYALIAISVTGWIAGDAVKEYSGLFSLGSVGLSYQSIMQIFILSVIISFIVALLCSDIVFRKTMLLWRYILIWFLSLISSGVFAAVFRWLPLDSWGGWVILGISLTVFFIIGAFGMIAKTKLEEKRYNKLLSDYKAKQGMEEQE